MPLGATRTTLMSLRNFSPTLSCATRVTLPNINIHEMD